MKNKVKPVNQAALLEKYIKRLVSKQPQWMRSLFSDERVVFCVEDDMSFVLAFSKDLAPTTKERVRQRVAAYMEKFPCSILQETVVQ